MKPGAIIIEGHVQGLSNTRSLGELGIPVYVLDQTHCIARHSKYCTKFFLCPAFDSNEFIPFLIELAQKEGLRDWLIMPSNDQIVEQLSNYKEELQPFYCLVIPDPVALSQIVDKWALMQVAKEAGTNAPKSWDISEVTRMESSQFPVLIKGKKGLGFYKTFHKKVIRVENEDQLHYEIERLGGFQDFFIQEEIRNSENEVISFTCFAEDGVVKAYWMGKKLREHPIKFGTATFAQSVFKQEILDEAIPLIDKLGYSGVCEIEFMLDDRDRSFKLIEINPRTWLWVGLAKACGCDYAKMLYYYANHIPQQFPESYTVDLKWKNRMTDLLYSIQAILKRELSVKAYLKSFRGKVVYAVWDNKDFVPGLVFPFLSFHILKHRR